MGSMSMVHWVVVVAAMTLLFGGGRIASSMGDLGKGLKAFRREMADAEAAPPRLEAPADH
ncbi:twin-arginine translocase TatA/TatE family subunit [Sphingomonas carotinifaciens]|uniref:Sec-independent protein translocase protein TatA n=1 Tax=Sphingomonas carotinifaciens TaxID=1166323 RepID=A0A1G7PVV6_9SPHN|nr:twin-arginine translocase TatA/TatE family subunit [Sphingomonas carotinifaciens]MBB4087530.1 sec-independent protein translocase protein TatA [Sphingomonas carotinifaciens]MWC45616.1 twin-arginine translocase TatA/TatE family subunit [Sphingomonas carotinifaciens]SDF90388.1 sec-independent protein translocase protein TatA [Sphingomonas carotinifaciens]